MTWSDALWRRRLEVVSALLAGIEQRGDVVDAVAAARTPADAQARVAQLLRIDDHAAEAVLNARLGGLTRTDAAALERERRDLHDRLDPIHRKDPAS